MSRSALLRETSLNQGHSEAGLFQEKQLIEAVGWVSHWLKEKMGISVAHSKILMNTEILDRCSGAKATLACPDSHIKPDGCLLYYLGALGNTNCILVCEHKKQGTNDDRTREGKSKQAKGNAIERSAKNIMAVQRFLCHETIFPYVVFAHGCDFEPGSSIIDRCHTMTHYRPLNTVHNRKIDGYGIPSIFVSGVRHNPWSLQEMFNILYSVAARSVRYYDRKNKIYPTQNRA